MKKAAVSFGLIFIGFLGGFVLREMIDENLDVDDCLDRGGAWNYEKRTCRYE